MKQNKESFNRTTPDGSRVCVIWIRVRNQKQVASLDMQMKTCRNYAAANSYGVEGFFFQTSECNTTKGRMYQDMISYVAKHKKINTVLVSSYDRLSRSQSELSEIKAKLESMGISIVSATQLTDKQ